MLPKQSVSWRLAMTMRDGEATLVDFAWKPGDIKPSIRQQKLPARGEVWSVWASADGNIYTTREIEYSNHKMRRHARIRVYMGDGSMIGEFRNPNDDEEISVPILTNDDRSVVCIGGRGELIIGDIDVERRQCLFRKLPEVSGLPAQRIVDFDLLLPLKGRRIACYARIGELEVYTIELVSGNVSAIPNVQLVGVVDGDLALKKGNRLARRVGEREEHIPARLTYRGWKSPHRVNRISPCGQFVFYDSGELLGFRLRLADLSSGKDRVIGELGTVRNIGSWHPLSK